MKIKKRKLQRLIIESIFRYQTGVPTDWLQKKAEDFIFNVDPAVDRDCIPGSQTDTDYILDTLENFAMDPENKEQTIRVVQNMLDKIVDEFIDRQDIEDIDAGAASDWFESGIIPMTSKEKEELRKYLVKNYYEEVEMYCIHGKMEKLEASIQRLTKNNSV